MQRAMQTMISALNQKSVDDAIKWLAEGHPIADDTAPPNLMAALIRLRPGDRDEVTNAALQYSLAGQTALVSNC